MYSTIYPLHSALHILPDPVKPIQIYTIELYL